MKRFVSALIAAQIFSGCLFAVAGSTGAVGTFVWLNGNLTRNYGQPLETAWEGTLHAVRNLKLKVVESKVDGFNGFIRIDTVKGEEIHINLERWTNVETKITVRVGVLGDRNKSERIHREIALALK